ncbi:hypothetical protein M422DRAFT_263628 [Sphaerobolus stellatus SS14]|uniref:DUF6699 domain-containing protein n=1 Tax=Sphaerobolus stellatus (strain SS14) TaxID=990650 RepID=A0A0C9UHI8_SPHS4|nr:hypothetical protein M422DRAFT_263628 [Sphaerobolus stellatus SS14]
MSHHSHPYGVASPATTPPAAPKRHSKPLPTTDPRDADFQRRAFSRSLQPLPYDLLWSVWEPYDEIPPTPNAPRLRCIPLPHVEYVRQRSSSRGTRRSNTDVVVPTIHRALQGALVYDFVQHPSTSVLLCSPLALRVILELVSPTIPFPHSAPATNPSQSHIFVDVGPHRDILVVASHGGIVTCGDVLHQLHEYLYQPLQDWEDRDMDHRRLLEAYQHRVNAKGSHDILRNIDALSGQTMFSRMVAGNLTGNRWTLQTSRPNV